MRVICGELGYRPAEFYALLWCEACIILAGHSARLERERWDRATLAYFVGVQAWTGARLPWELLGEEDPNPERREQQRRRDEAAALELMGAKAQTETPEDVLRRYGIGGEHAGK